MRWSERGERLDAVVAHLRSRGGTSMGELARELGVSVRTIRRDIAALRGRGIDVEGERGRGGGVRLSRYAPLPPLHLDEEQAVGLWLSVQLARRATGLPFSHDGGVGLEKVLAALPAERRRGLRDLTARIRIGGPASPPLVDSLGAVSPALLGAFERCFREQVCLGFQYTDRVGATSQRRVEPHGLYVEAPVWYVLAVDVDKQAPRMFRMDRIAKPRPIRRHFEPSLALLDAMMARGQEFETLHRPGARRSPTH